MAFKNVEILGLHKGWYAKQLFGLNMHCVHEEDIVCGALRMDVGTIRGSQHIHGLVVMMGGCVRSAQWKVLDINRWLICI
jgi:hypothetical protein